MVVWQSVGYLRAANGVIFPSGDIIVHYIDLLRPLNVPSIYSIIVSG